MLLVDSPLMRSPVVVLLGSRRPLPPSEYHDTTSTFTPSFIHRLALKLSIHIAPFNQLLVSAFSLSLQCLCPSPPPSSTITSVAEGLGIVP